MRLEDTIMVQVPLSLLKQVEWRWREGIQVCPVCDESAKQGHKADCRLALAIHTVDDNVKIQQADPIQEPYTPDEMDPASFVG